jgi:hypothetical protein
MSNTDIAIPDEPQAPGLFRTEQPREVVRRATDIANELAQVVKKQRLAVAIQGRDHVRVEGWTLLGSMLGVFPVCVWTRKLDNGWEARVEARTLTGALVGAAEAECLRSERTWASRDDYALRSMAQTRATSKALRQPLGFVMVLAGFDATPAEEMPTGGSQVDQDSMRDLPDHELLIHFGKNKGTRLADLTGKQLEWYAQTWEPNPQFASTADWQLKEAARRLHGGETQPEIIDEFADVPFE